MCVHVYEYATMCCVFMYNVDWAWYWQFVASVGQEKTNVLGELHFALFENKQK